MAFSFGRGAVPTLEKGIDTRSSNYGGVLRLSGDYRLIVSRDGSRYILQHHPFARADWNVKAWALSLSVLIGRFPDGLFFEDLPGLPDNPKEVSRSWGQSSSSSIF
jgi:hypothetical protein